ncbi:MAG: hypothetical protein COA96_03150 [SAR86 cluster bacterium]|uniref:DUF2306 domain-containing protein n=1 Tax=SAR86 cluster bacterium TaxID=2030880 RepID=A0A2A5B821_9GAMM|nr:MAG: hypothetical protein COA96_03150 [SAR86 cluster bacterium]
MISNTALDRTLYIYMVVVLSVFAVVASGSLVFVPDSYGSSGVVAMLASGAHIFFGVLYVLGPIAQFNGKIRSKFPSVHRWLGRLTLIAMVATAVFGMWMNLAPGNTHFQLGMRTMALFLIFWVPLCAYKAFTSARKRNFQLHQIWVLRLAAVAVGNGALRFGLIGFMIITGGTEGTDEFVDQTIWFFIGSHSILVELYIQHKFFTGVNRKPSSA